jgi:hypothetical protein
MDSLDQVPISISHTRKRLVPQDSGIIDNDINSSISFHSSLYNTFAIFNAIVVCDCLSASRNDFIYYYVGSG